MNSCQDAADVLENDRDKACVKAVRSPAARITSPAGRNRCFRHADPALSGRGVRPYLRLHKRISHDAANAIATVVSTGVPPVRTAVLLMAMHPRRRLHRYGGGQTIIVALPIRCW